MRGTTRLWAVAMWFGCAPETVDLRSPELPPPPACAEGERQNPNTRACEPCFRQLADPADVCLCQAQWFGGDFPLCEGDADFECLPCAGTYAACQAYDSGAGVVRDCDSFLLCCEALAERREQVGDASRCCAEGTQARCIPLQGSGEYQLVCDTQ